MLQEQNLSLEQNVPPITSVIEDRHKGNGNGTEDYVSSTLQSTNKLVDNVNNEIQLSLQDQVTAFLQSNSSTDPQEQLKTGLKLLKKAGNEDPDSPDKMDASIARFAIRTGKILNKLKTIINLFNYQKWGDWADKNINFITKRTRQTYMQLAKCKGAENYTALGKERLLHLTTITKDLDDDDPIGFFLSQYKDYNPQDQNPNDELKDIVDSALLIHKANKLQIALDYDRVKGAISSGIRFAPVDLDNMKRIKNANLDPHKYIDHLNTKNEAIDELLATQKKEEREQYTKDQLLKIAKANPTVLQQSIDQLMELQEK